MKISKKRGFIVLFLLFLLPVVFAQNETRNCIDKCGDGICEEIVCLSLACPCGETTENCPTDCKAQTTCTESDNRVDLFKKGTTTGIDDIGKEISQIDYCSDKYRIIEYYCHPDTNKVNSVINICYGGCIDGACIKSDICLQTDKSEKYPQGDDPYTQGCFEYDCDKCKSERILYERGCSEGTNFQTDIECSYGCKDGACLKEEVKCADSDGGKNGFVSGKTSLGNNVYYDVCYDNSVVEYYCSYDSTTNQEFIKKDTISCQYGCSDGTCKSGITTDKPNPPIDLSNYPYMFIRDNKANVILVVGDNAPAEDVISISDIAMSLQYKIEGSTTTGTVTKIEVGVTKLASEIPDPTKLNIISVGNSCNNKVSAKLMGYPASCTKGVPQDHGTIKLYNYNEYAQIVLFGNSNSDTRKTAKVLTNWKDYALEGKEMCVSGTSTSPYVKSGPCQETTCTDSDGGRDYYKKGESFGIVADRTARLYTDGCDINTTSRTYGHLVEYYCFNNKLIEEFYKCPNSCSNGACIKTKCPSGGYQCDEKGYYVQKCDDNTGQWYNAQYCEKGCENGKCKTYSCGNGICEPGEDAEICEEIACNICEEGKVCDCPQPEPKCYTVCPQDCPTTRPGIYANLNQEFTLEVGQSAKVIDYKYMKIVLNNIEQPRCITAPCYPIATITVGLPPGDPAQGQGEKLIITKGQSQELYGTLIKLIDIAPNKAAFVVSLARPSCGDGICSGDEAVICPPAPYCPPHAMCEPIAPCISCPQDCKQECKPKDYQCQDGTYVPWCKCDDYGNTICRTSPEAQCKSCGDNICTSQETTTCANDCDFLGKYLILHDIGNYRFINARYAKQNDYGGMVIYAAEYSSYNNIKVIVAELKDEETAKEVFKKELLSQGYSTMELNGNIVYLTNNGRMAAWTNNNLIIGVETSGRASERAMVERATQATAKITGGVIAEAIKPAYEKIEASKTAKLKEIRSRLAEKEELSIKEVQMPQEPIRALPKEIIIAYLEMYPSDYIKEPICGNRICEEGEANEPGGCGPNADPGCLGPPAREGTCPEDCIIPRPCLLIEYDPEKEIECLAKGGKWAYGGIVNDCPVPPYCIYEGKDITEVERLAVIMKLEKIKTTINDLKNKAAGLAIYYKRQGEASKVELWDKIASMFDNIINNINIAEKKVKTMETENLKEYVGSVIGEIETSLKEIVDVIISSLEKEELSNV